MGLSLLSYVIGAHIPLLVMVASLLKNKKLTGVGVSKERGRGVNLSEIGGAQYQ
jgi:hypothetical protein